MTYYLRFAIIIAAMWITASAGAQQPPPLVPTRVGLSPAVKAAIDDPLLTDAERTTLRIFHGQFESLDDGAKATAAAALARHDLTDPSLNGDDTPPLLRAEAAFERGELDFVLDLLKADESSRGRLLRGLALSQLGRFDQAVVELAPLRLLMRENDDDAARITDIVIGMAELARLEGRPSQDYQQMLNMLTRARQQVDRLYWPALIAQADLLLDKDNPAEAVEALHEALSLNPACDEAWYRLGLIAARGFNFEAAERAVEHLLTIQPDHPYVPRIEAHVYLTQKDAGAAQRVIDAALERLPQQRELLALKAAAAALAFDDVARDAAVTRFADLSGRNPQAWYYAGRYMSLARQYDEAAKLLAEAIRLQPNWPAPQIELGLLLSQAGNDQLSLQVLRGVAQLDPFNKRAANTLKLQEELAGYDVIETDHFTIRYRQGIDAALARDMPGPLEEIYKQVTEAYQHPMRRKTLIEILPDKQSFAVRITGMPDIWTIAACTGPVVALTPPREGRRQSGAFDWYRVIRHEFTHTVTLEKTGNRIPHWLTEAIAVSQELAPRSYEDCQMLAAALEAGELFDLVSINWAFVRPRKPTDRAQAYAQGHWMVQYITERFGHATVVKMLDLSRQGVPQMRIVPEATGQEPEAFMSGFTQWATQQVREWGLSPQPPTQEVLTQIKDAGDNAPAKLEALLEAHPRHPDLLQLKARQAVDAQDDDRAVVWLQRYAEARPVDAWADQELARVMLRLDRPAAAVAHLEHLDRIDDREGAYARQLVAIHRDVEQLDAAQRAAERVIVRTPYDPAARETAAVIALRRGDQPAALRHIQALTDIEPDRAPHWSRLAALHHRMGQTREADAAARKAMELDPDAPVKKFLSKN